MAHTSGKPDGNSCDNGIGLAVGKSYSGNWNSMPPFVK